jgi:hypothetical protein
LGIAGEGAAAGSDTAGGGAGGSGTETSAAGAAGVAGGKPEGGAPAKPDYCGEAGAASVGNGTGATQADLLGTWHLQDGGGEDIFLEIRANGTGEYAVAYSDAHTNGYVTWTGPIEVSETLITLHATTGTYSSEIAGAIVDQTLPPQTLRFRYSFDAQTVTLYLSAPDCGDPAFDSPSVGYLSGPVALKHDP